MALLLSAWLLGPWHRVAAAQPGPGLRVLLVDVSDSVVRRAPRFELELGRLVAEEARRARAADEELLAITFAREVRRWFGPVDADAALERLARGDAPVPVAPQAGAQSDLAGAASLALELARGRRVAALRVISDGNWTGRDPHPDLCALEALGAPRTWSSPPAPELPDLALTALDLPRRLAEGTPLTGLLRLAFEPGSGPRAGVPFELEVVLEQAGSEATWPRSGRTPQAPEWSLPLELGAAVDGTTRVAVSARLATGARVGDAVPENDWAFGEVEVGENVRVAVLGGPARGAAAESLVDSLSGVPGLAPRSIRGEELAAAFSRGDVLVTLDLDPRELPAAALKSHLEEGGGWLDLAGRTTLFGWDRADARAALAALDLSPRDLPPRDVVLMVDGSGSMGEGAIDDARAAARALARRAAPGERVVVRWFTAHLEDARSADDPESLAPREPGGETDVLGSLEELVEARAAREREALVFLLSDGRDQPAADARLADLPARLRASRVELRVFAVGARADLGFLGRLAGPRGVTAVTPGMDLAGLFARAAAERRLREDGPLPVWCVAHDGAALGSGVVCSATTGAPGLPDVERCVRARGRPDAVVLCETGDGEAVLAVRAVGLGLSAGFASLPVAAGAGEPWAPGWFARPELLGALVRWLGAERGSGPVRLTLGAGRLRIEEVPPEWPAAVRARRAGDPGPGELLLAEAGVALDPRGVRVGAWPFGPGEVEVLEDGPGAALGSYLVRGTGTPEFEARPPSARLRKGGGEPAEAPLGPARGPHRLALPFLAGGLALLLAASLAWGRA